MTQNKIGWNLYWLYAVYLGAIPALLILGGCILVKNIFNTSFSLPSTYILSIWPVSAICSALLIKKPYHKLYEKYNWEYDGKKIYNAAKEIDINLKDIDRIYIGYEKPIPLYVKVLKVLGYRDLVEYRSVVQKSTLVLELKNKRICFLQIALLHNGKVMHDAIVFENKEKIADKPYDLEKYTKHHSKIKYYQILECDKF